MAIADGLQSSVQVEVCYPDTDPCTPPDEIGDPVRVRLETPFTFVPLLGIGTITLRGEATMRLEQEPNKIVDDPCS
jgi:hypothetical protein